jgi:hypothetical protein
MYGVLYTNDFAYLKTNAEYWSAERYIPQDTKQKHYKWKGKAT